MKSFWKFTIVGGVIASMLLSLFGIWYATNQANSHYGPSKIRVTPQGEVWVLSDGALHVLDAVGEVQNTLRLRDWGRAFLPSDFYPMSNGDLLVAEPDTHEIYRCSLGAACVPLLAASRITIGSTKNAMLLAVDEERQRLYVADNAGHRLLLLDLSGNLLDATSRHSARFWFPNQIALHGGELLVANTNYRKIERLPVLEDRFGEADWTLRTAVAEVRPGRKWPMSFIALPNGQWWVGIAREGMRNADVAVFDSTKMPTGYIPLENHADPVSMAVLSDRVLLADTDNYRVRQVSLTGELLADFGSAAFREVLKQQAATSRFWLRVRTAAQISVGVVPLLGVLLLWRMGERTRGLPKNFNFQRAVLPITPGTIHWFELRPQFVRQQQWLLGILTFATMFLTGWSLWMMVHYLWKLPAGSWVLSTVLVCGLGLVFVSVFLGYRTLHVRLGTDGVQLLHDNGNGKVFSYPLSQVISDGSRLLAGNRLIVLRILPRLLYERDELEQYLLARLGTASLCTPGQFYLAGLRQGNQIFWMNTVLILLIVLAWVLTRVNHSALQVFLLKHLS